MTDKKITWEMTLTLFWAQMWRTIPFFVIAGGASVYAYYEITKYLGVDPAVQSWMGAALGFYVGLIVALWVVRRLLTNGFGKYSLLIVKKDEADEVDEVDEDKK